MYLINLFPKVFRADSCKPDDVRDIYRRAEGEELVVEARQAETVEA